MADRVLVDAWLAKADEDCGFAASCLSDEDEFFGQICFHFQQAAEKYLKAFIVAYDLPFRKIHNLPVLLQSCGQQHVPLVSLLIEPCQLLNRYYIDTRYPVHWPTNFTKADAVEAHHAAQNIGDAVKAALFPTTPS